MPSVPDAAIAPAEKVFSYFAFIICGKARRLKRVTDAPTMPVAVANTVPVASVATAREPGSQPNMTRTAWKSSSRIPARSMR